MTGILETATSGRAKCRGCGQPIARGELRLGERLPNPFAEGEMTHWFHPLCAAYKRPEVLLEALGQPGATVAERERLEAVARRGVAQPRLPRIDGAERAPSSQARCRQCKEPIAKGDWRIRLVFHQEGQFEPGGFLHLACRTAYFETPDVLEPVLHFSTKLSEGERGELRTACGTDS
jgi:hypothetical protein